MHLAAVCTALRSTKTPNVLVRCLQFGEEEFDLTDSGYWKRKLRLKSDTEKQRQREEKKAREDEKRKKKEEVRVRVLCTGIEGGENR